MADIEKNPATLLDELAALDPPQRREVARLCGGGRDVRRGARRQTASHVLGVLARLDPA